MQVIYEKTVVQKIRDEIAKAKTLRRTIERIVLTQEEAFQMKEYVNGNINRGGFYFAPSLGRMVGSYRGVRIETEEMVEDDDEF